MNTPQNTPPVERTYYLTPDRNSNNLILDCLLQEAIDEQVQPASYSPPMNWQKQPVKPNAFKWERVYGPYSVILLIGSMIGMAVCAFTWAFFLSHEGHVTLRWDWWL